MDDGLSTATKPSPFSMPEAIAAIRPCDGGVTVWLGGGEPVDD
jgi:hypothetical protein